MPSAKQIKLKQAMSDLFNTIEADVKNVEVMEVERNWPGLDGIYRSKIIVIVNLDSVTSIRPEPLRPSSNGEKTIKWTP